MNFDELENVSIYPEFILVKITGYKREIKRVSKIKFCWGKTKRKEIIINVPHTNYDPFQYSLDIDNQIS